MIGSVLVILIIFLFLRNFRSTLIVCTAIPISVVGTFALLYFAGLTLNTMTFGGLALGVGMIVDAAIVVLENSFRHMEHHGKDRMTASDRRQRRGLVGHSGVDPHAHRRVRAAALPAGRLERHVPAAVRRRRASRWRCRCSSRSRSCRCSARSCSCCRRPPTSGRGSADGSHVSERALDGMDDGLPPLAAQGALPTGRPSSAMAAASVVAAALIFPTLPTEFATQTDEGQVRSTCRAAAGHAHRGHRSGAEAARGVDQPARAGSDRRHRQRRRRRRRRFGGGGVNRGQFQLLLKPKDERTRSSDQIAQDLRRQLVGHSRRDRPRERVGRQPAAQPAPLGRQQRRRPALARDPRREPRRLAEGRPVG